MSSTLSGRCINHSFAHLQDSVGATEVTIATDGLACSTMCVNICVIESDTDLALTAEFAVTSLNTALWTVSLWGGLSVPVEGNLKAAACSYISDNVFLQLSFNSLCLALSCFHTTIVLQKKVSSIKTLNNSHRALTSTHTLKGCPTPSSTTAAPSFVLQGPTDLAANYCS